MHQPQRLDARGGFEQRLQDVVVEIDRGGRVIVTFRAERRGRDLMFTGNIVGREEGRHEELLQKKGIYYAMYQRQQQEDSSNHL